MPLEYFVKVLIFTDKHQIWISDKNIDGTWIRISPCIYSPNTVSYTHLDVYKRQVLNLLEQVVLII